MDDAMEIKDDIAVNLSEPPQTEEDVEAASIAYHLMTPAVLTADKAEKVEKLVNYFIDVTEVVISECPDSNFRENAINKLIEAKHWALFSLYK